MNFFRNPEIKRLTLIYIFLTLSVGSLGFIIADRFRCLTYIVCIIFSLINLISTYRQYKYIYQLNSSIDTILHGNEHIVIPDYSEGELAILHNEISKMLSRLSEQNDRLIKDKTFLADSIADISHQLKTPLTSVNLLVSMLSKPELTYEQRVELLCELNQLLSKTDWLIDTLLKMSKLDTGSIIFSRTRISASELIRRSISPIEIPLELKGISIDYNIPDDIYFFGDITWTAEALLNIIKNCMEHTSSGGTITISALENSIYTQFVIKDNGTGISVEDLPHLFERFYRGKNSGENSVGIGLFLARQIITAQNGTIKAENSTPSGAVFTIRFIKVVV